MKTYVCHKKVRATPMNRGDYNALRGWFVPANESPADDGFLVEYLDGGAANVPGFTGYVSWSPKDVFERGYSEVLDPAAGTAGALAMHATGAVGLHSESDWSIPVNAAKTPAHPPHQQRVYDELTDLLDRLRKLRAFIEDKKGLFPGLPRAERARMEHQEEIMSELAAILAERTAAFK